MCSEICISQGWNFAPKTELCISAVVQRALDLKCCIDGLMFEVGALLKKSFYHFKTFFMCGCKVRCVGVDAIKDSS